MKQTMSTYDIASELRRDENADWSWPGALALAEYLQEFEDNAGMEMEFDRVAIRCDFSEYNSLREWADYYFVDWLEDLGVSTPEDEEETADIIREYIQDHGTLIEFDGGIIVSSF